MNKKEYRAYRADWEKALKDGRVVRLSETTLRSYPTIAMRDHALAELKAAGLPVSIVTKN